MAHHHCMPKLRHVIHRGESTLKKRKTPPLPPFPRTALKTGDLSLKMPKTTRFHPKRAVSRDFNGKSRAWTFPRAAGVYCFG